MAAPGFGGGANRVDAQARCDVGQCGNPRRRVYGQGGTSGRNYNDEVVALRYAYILALVVWLGGMVVLGALVAPTTFQVLQASDPATGRALAGAVFGATIARFHYVAYGAGAILLLTLMIMAVLGPRPRHFAVRTGIVVAMLAVSSYSGIVVLGDLERVQRDAGGLPSLLPATDARRVEFDALHLLSERLMMLTMAGAFVLLCWEARE